MNKIIKFSAAALLTLFIVGCNKEEPAVNNDKQPQAQASATADVNNAQQEAYQALQNQITLVKNLSEELKKDSAALLANPTEEGIKQLNAKTAKTNEEVQVLEKLKAEYVEKYGQKAQ
ncbi:hypothetical protein ACLSY8_03615 [Avibacterium avium]|uniref:Lipoprotein HlpB n=1 Tax=Avibacterium paragallinarum TaxID=728 RepID=A0ABU7QLY5_AVIPA|nr:hypothetical protein [Avibacterium paragallinarum]